MPWEILQLPCFSGSSVWQLWQIFQVSHPNLFLCKLSFLFILSKWVWIIIDCHHLGNNPSLLKYCYCVLLPSVFLFQIKQICPVLEYITPNHSEAKLAGFHWTGSKLLTIFYFTGLQRVKFYWTKEENVSSVSYLLPDFRWHLGE